MKNFIAKVAGLVAHVRHSCNASEVLDGWLELQPANQTRWNSQLKMLRSLLRIPKDRLDNVIRIFQNYVGRFHSVHPGIVFTRTASDIEESPFDLVRPNSQLLAAAPAVIRSPGIKPTTCSCARRHPITWHQANYLQLRPPSSDRLASSQLLAAAPAVIRSPGIKPTTCSCARRHPIAWHRPPSVLPCNGRT